MATGEAQAVFARTQPCGAAEGACEVALVVKSGFHRDGSDEPLGSFQKPACHEKAHACEVFAGRNSEEASELALELAERKVRLARDIAHGEGIRIMGEDVLQGGGEPVGLARQIFGARVGAHDADQADEFSGGVAHGALAAEVPLRGAVGAGHQPWALGRGASGGEDFAILGEVLDCECGWVEIVVGASQHLVLVGAAVQIAHGAVDVHEPVVGVFDEEVDGGKVVEEFQPLGGVGGMQEEGLGRGAWRGHGAVIHGGADAASREGTG